MLFYCLLALNKLVLYDDRKISEFEFRHNGSLNGSKNETKNYANSSKQKFNSVLFLRKVAILYNSLLTVSAVNYVCINNC